MAAKTWLLVYSFVFQTLLAQEIENELRNYQVIEVGGVQSFQSEEDFFIQLNLPLDSDLEILKEDAMEGTVQVLVNPDLQKDFLAAVRNHKLSYEVIIEDIGQLLQNSKLIRAEMADLNGEATFDRYMTFEEIERFLKTTQETFPQKVRLTTIGQSYEGENITMITISDNMRRIKGRIKPIIFIEGGMHAREWISMASAVYLIDTLVKSRTDLTQEIEWKIVPVANPDGYKYSWNKHRFWRKNRRPHFYSHCYGVDLNRNFDSFWNKVGTSSQKCSAIYAGREAFSEPETRAIRDVFADPEIRNRVKAYVSIHSYGQYILLPPGYNKIDLSPECSDVLKSVAEMMSSAILGSSGPKYIHGTPAQVLYPASGGSMDWAMLTKKVPLAFTFEMRDKGKYGFLLPASQIKTTVTDIWVAVMEIFKVVTEKDASQLQSVKKYEACELEQFSLRSSSDEDFENGTEIYNLDTSTAEPNELFTTESEGEFQNNSGSSIEAEIEYAEMANVDFRENEVEESVGPSATSSVSDDNVDLFVYNSTDSSDLSEEDVHSEIKRTDAEEYTVTPELTDSIISDIPESMQSQDLKNEDDTIFSWDNPEVSVSTEPSYPMSFDVESDSEYSAPAIFRHPI